MLGTSLDGSYFVIVQATKTSDQSYDDFQDLVTYIRNALDSFPGAITILDVLASTIAVPTSVSWYFKMSSRYPEETIMNTLRTIAHEYNDTASIAWLEVTDKNL